MTRGNNLVPVYLLLLFMGCSSGLLELRKSVNWQFHRSLYDYTVYGAISLERIDIPAHSVVANLNSSIESSSKSCPLLYVKIFANQFGFPVVSRDNEVFPNNVFVSSVPVVNVSVASNNETVIWEMNHLQEGQLFLLAVKLPPDSRIKQKGLEEECDYFMNTQVTVLHYVERDIPQLGSPVNSYVVTLSTDSQTILSFQVAKDTQSYIVDIQGCPGQHCPANVSVWETLDLNMADGGSHSCNWTNGSCRLQVTSPSVNRQNYLFLSSSDANINLTVGIEMRFCDKNYSVSDLTTIKDTPFTCILTGDLGRETPRRQSDSSNFNDRFVTWDKNGSPHSVVNLRTPDTAVVVTRFNLHTSDTGTSLKVSLHLPVGQFPNMSRILLCLSVHRLHHPWQCDSGAVVNVTNLKDKNKDEIIVPYPQAGVWFISVKSQCFHIDPNKSEEIVVPCNSTLPVANLTVKLAPCIDGGCGKYGTCKLYMETDLLYSACNCYSGWRGYGCNDGSKAVSDGLERLAVYLLTLSNLGFIPGICLAIHRKFYVEALVYFYNMFFSTFYHACDSSGIYQLCIMPYNALSFADFFASLLSFWVTLMIMARIPHGVRSFLHMLSALFISLGEVYNRHGLVEQLLPIAGGVFIVIVSWGVESYRRKTVFPSKKRLLRFILPGLVLSSMGLIIVLAFQTESNYKYVHSTWHLLVSLSILFLLPPGRYKSDTSGSLSVQSGDITRQPFHERPDEYLANIHHADDIDVVAPREPASPPLTPSIGRERGLKLQSRQQSRQSLVL